MKKILPFTLVLVLLIPALTGAEAAYEPLAKGLGGLNIGADSLGEYFNTLFELTVLVGSVLAVLMIAIGGLQYMTTDSVSGKGSGRERIKQAVLGLLMLLGVWLFFKEINPNILKLDFELEKVQTDGKKVKYQPKESGGSNSIEQRGSGSQDTLWIEAP